ncbi:ATP-binding cassette domain-containing protein [Kitasatospora acidiphila]|uniref:ATP-binding cassette domain-containing protein n=1 Tax=Kitasatospora acidiphila TaxID=2567942 RepID=A0A540WCE1_9ACTN|nr:ATP-binding cassette domain-containing protein [Kitasatospora acidiphila]TQF06683.1 ATP-binding cassette domain-containing protein [Kitasatospora acidiphila]
MIEVEQLSKRYGGTLAVDDVSFRAPSGRVTALLGPNGAGKSTTLRILLGLARPDGGRALINGTGYRELDEPLKQVGALLEAGAVHKGRTGYQHLRWLAESNRLPVARVRIVLEQTGLAARGRTRIAGYSLGMTQRLGLAAALLGDPGVLVLDEPLNGLDAEGISQLRSLLRQLADEGRTVLVSSHLMAEVARTADHLVVIGCGRVLADLPTAELIARHVAPGVRVSCAEPARLADLLRSAGAVAQQTPDGALAVTGVTAAEVGALAARHQLALDGLSRTAGSLEDAYLNLLKEA